MDVAFIKLGVWGLGFGVWGLGFGSAPECLKSMMLSQRPMINELDVTRMANSTASVRCPSHPANTIRRLHCLAVLAGPFSPGRSGLARNCTLTWASGSHRHEPLFDLRSNCLARFHALYMIDHSHTLSPARACSSP